MNLNLPEVPVSDRTSIVQRVKVNERTTLANLEGPGCIRHIWGTAGREGNGRNRLSFVSISTTNPYPTSKRRSETFLG